tara:strand:- start:150 stop:452 length:303 start_codon:yes stop_codon:yes gene_type:complete
MKKFKEFTGVGSVAGLTGVPPVHLKKKKKKDIEVMKRFIKDRLESRKRMTDSILEKAPDTADAMKRYKAGKAGFGDISHLKAKGLIARSDGEKRKSDKYK